MVHRRGFYKRLSIIHWEKVRGRSLFVFMKKTENDTGVVQSDEKYNDYISKLRINTESVASWCMSHHKGILIL